METDKSTRTLHTSSHSFSATVRSNGMKSKKYIEINQIQGEHLFLSPSAFLLCSLTVFIFQFIWDRFFLLKLHKMLWYNPFINNYVKSKSKLKRWLN